MGMLRWCYVVRLLLTVACDYSSVAYDAYKPRRRTSTRRVSAEFPKRR